MSLMGTVDDGQVEAALELKNKGFLNGEWNQKVFPIEMSTVWGSNRNISAHILWYFIPINLYFIQKVNVFTDHH